MPRLDELGCTERATGTCMCFPNPRSMAFRSNRPQQHTFIPGTASWRILSYYAVTPERRLRSILPRYIIVFSFETSMRNLIRQRKDHLSLQPCRPPQRKMNLDDFSLVRPSRNPLSQFQIDQYFCHSARSSSRLSFPHSLTSIIPSPY